MIQEAMEDSDFYINNGTSYVYAEVREDAIRITAEDNWYSHNIDSATITKQQAKELGEWLLRVSESMK